MKKLFLFILIFLSTASYLLSQAPEGFKYQAVARDANNMPQANANIALRISLIRDGVSGIIDYSERHQVTTTDLGVFSLQIGAGTVLNGNFSTLNWGSHSYFIKVDADPAGGTNYSYMGISQLLSVPYAIYAKSAGSGGTSADNDPQNEIQTLNLNGNQLTLSNGGGAVTLPAGSGTPSLQLSGTMLSISGGNTVNLSALQDGVNDADADPANEIQTINFDSNTNQLSISGGNSISIPSGGTDADADPTNEIQTISKSGTTVSLSNNGGSFTDETDDADANPMNEIQTISLNGTQINLSNGGGSINLPTGTTDTDDQMLSLTGTNLSIDDGNTVDLSSLPDNVDDADADPTNEIQTISLNGTQINLSNGGGSISLPTGTTDTDDQTLSLNGTNLSIDDGNTVDLSSLPDNVDDADANPMNEIQVLSLNGTQISLSNGGGSINLPTGTTDTDDQTLSLNGTNLSIDDGNTVDLSILQDGVNDADADPVNEIQTISLNGTQINLSNGGGSINLPTGTTDTDDQMLSLNGTNLSIDDGNTVDLSILQDGVNDADADPLNEIQTISLNGTQINLSNGGGSINLPTGTTDTDDQTLSLNGTNLSIDDGNTVDLSSLPDNVDDADADPVNEIQTISLNGTQINLSNGGGSINLPAGTTDTDDQMLSLNGTDLSIDDGNTVDLSALQDGVNDADADPTNELQTISKTGNFIMLSNGGEVVDEVNDADADPTNEIQTISKAGTTVTLSNTGGSFIDAVDDADADPTNEIQTISKAGTTVTLSNTGGFFIDAVDDADANPTNEIQSLSLNGNSLSISNGNNVNLGGIGGLWSTHPMGIHYTGGDIGFGTTSPVYPYQFENDIFINSSVGAFRIGTVGADQWLFGTVNGGKDLQLFSGTADNSLGSKITFKQNGKVGFGTSNPMAKLEIKGAAIQDAYITSTDNDGTAALKLTTNNDPNDGLSVFKAGYSAIPFVFADGTPINGQGIIQTGPSASGLILNASGLNSMSFMANDSMRMTLSPTGQLGIGTTSPSAPLHIKGGDILTPVLKLQGDDPWLAFNNTNGTLGGNLWYDTNDERMVLTNNNQDGSIAFNINFQDKMTINQLGDVGIGTTSPANKLHIVGDMRIEDSTPSIQLYNGADWRGYVYHDDADMIYGNILVGAHLFQTNALTNAKIDQEGIEILRQNQKLELKNIFNAGSIIQATNNGSPDDLRIATSGLAISPDGAVTAGNYPVRIVQPSIYGLNLFAGSSEKDWEIYVADDGLRLYADDSYRGIFDATTGVYTSVSDKRLKTNIRSMDGILAAVLDLKPSRYEYIDNNPKQKESIGFVAQEVQALFPELVHESNDKRSKGMLTLNYAGFSVLAIKAIQEQQMLIDQQNQQIKNQQKEIDELKLRLDKIEALLMKN